MLEKVKETVAEALGADIDTITGKVKSHEGRNRSESEAEEAV